MNSYVIKQTIYKNEKAINALMLEKKQALKTYKRKMTEQDRIEHHKKFDDQYHALVLWL